MRAGHLSFVCCFVSSFLAEARAADLPEAAVESRPTLSTAVEDGSFLPRTVPASVGRHAVLVSTYGGYDGARDRATANVAAEARVWGPVAFRAGAEYTGGDNAARPMVGARAQILRQHAHGLDGAVTVCYRPEGFTEPEGEIETTVSLARHIERFTAVGNLTYGQDPEGKERDGEVALALLHRWQQFALGVDSRLRFAIGPSRSAAEAIEPRFDLVAGPVGVVTAGPVALSAQVGSSVLRVAGHTSAGMTAIAGVGAVF